MQAIIWTGYGAPEVLQLQEIAKPAPKDDEILVKIIAANVFPGDCELRKFQIHPLYWLPLRLAIGIRKPRVKILGQEFSGIVESVGTQVTRFKPGDEIVSPTGLGGAYAEYLCLKGNHAAFKPLNVSHAEAATVSVGGLNALHLMRTAEIRAGQRVLLNGAGGCIGTLAIQLAKNLGAEVTAVDSTEKLPVLESIGADHVIDYTRQDFTKNGETYDVIIDIVGKSSYSRSLRSLKKDGYFVLANAPTSHLIRSLWSRVFGSRRVRPVLTSYKAEDLAYLMELLEAGKLKPVIDRHYRLNQVVDAHRYVDSGRKTGNVVLTVSDLP